MMRPGSPSLTHGRGESDHQIAEEGALLRNIVVFCKGRTAPAVLGLLIVAACGGAVDSSGRGAADRSPTGGDLPAAVQAALPRHVAPQSLLQTDNGCYAYQVGTPDLGYVAPLISADGAQVCL